MPSIRVEILGKKLKVYALSDWSWSKQFEEDFRKFWVIGIEVQDDLDCGCIAPGSFVYSKSADARGIIVEMSAEIHVEPYAGAAGAAYSRLEKVVTVNVHWIDPVEVDPGWKTISGELIPIEKLLGGDYLVRAIHPFERRNNQQQLLTYGGSAIHPLPLLIGDTLFTEQR